MLLPSPGKLFPKNQENKMEQAQALQYLKDARPIFELAEQHGSIKLTDKLAYGQFSLLEQLAKVWQAGLSGPEIEDLCRQAGYNSWQVKPVSLYFWNTQIVQQMGEKETVRGWINTIFWIITGIGVCAVMFFLIIVLDLGVSRRGDNEFYAWIGLIICSPLLGVGYLFREAIMSFMDRSFNSRRKQTWPKGLYPDNEEGRTDLEK